MTDPENAIRRRVDQFQRLLQVMNTRAHEVAEGPCYTIFEQGDRVDARLADRFAQFAFEEHHFQLDLPVQTLSRKEAVAIQRERCGFFYLSERPKFTLNEEDVDGHEPFRKIYVYGEERLAAEDLAFVIFRVWNLAPEATLSVSSAAFDGRYVWDDATSLVDEAPSD